MWSARDVEIVAVDLARHVVVVLEGDHRAAVLQQPLLGRRRLHHAAVRREIAGEHRGRAVARDRIVERVDDLALVDFGAVDVLAKGLAGDGQAGQIEHAAQLVHQRAQAAGIEEILHQEFAGRAHIGDHRHLARQFVEAVHVERHAGAARHRHHMDDGSWSSRPSPCARLMALSKAAGVRIFCGVRSSHTMSTMRRPALRAHARMGGIGRRDRRRARQRQAERLGDRHHGRRRAHHHAGAERARDAAFDLVPVLVADAAGALLVPVFPGVGAGAELLPAPVAAQHRARRHDRSPACPC